MPIADILRGERVRLTALTNHDLPALAAWQRDSQYLRLLDAEPAHPRGETQLAAWLEEEQKSKTAFLFAVRRLEGDDVIGYLALDGILWPHRSAWLTIGIGDPAHRGQGYGTEALRLALRFAFHELNLRRVQLTVFSYNERAIAVYERLGFRREGTYREALERDGQLHDMYLYGLLRREWEEGHT